MDPTGSARRIEFASIVLGTPADSTQSVIYSQSPTYIHRHAMQEVLRRRRNPSSRDYAPARAVLQPQSALTGKFRVKASLRKRGAKEKIVTSEADDNAWQEAAKTLSIPTSIVPIISASKSDPFGVLPVEIGPSQELLLRLIHTTSYMQNPIALNPESSRLAYAVSDSALLHALFSLVALHHDLSFGTRISPLCLMHRGETLRIVNQRLTKMPLTITDGTIGAVAALATFDLLDGRTQSSGWNIRGLRQMIVERGGLHALGKEAMGACGSWLLQRAICWSDLCSSAVSGEKPYLPVTLCSPSPLDTHPPSSLSAVSMPSNLNLVFDALSQLSAIISELHISFSDRVLFSDNLYVTEHSLLSLPPDPHPHTYDESCRVAATIYLYLFLRQIPQTATIYQILLHRLRASLNQSAERNNLFLGSQLSNLRLLWICFIGSTASNTPSEVESGRREWWVSILRYVSGALGLVSKGDFDESLNCVVRMGTLGEEARAVIWNEIYVGGENVEGHKSKFNAVETAYLL